MSRKGRRSKYHIYVEPNLQLITEMKSSGATIQEICNALHINTTSWYEYINKHPALNEALAKVQYDKTEILPLTNEQIETITFPLIIYIQYDPEDLDEMEEYKLTIRKYETYR